MKKFSDLIRLTIIATGCLLLISVLLSACKKSNDGISNNTPLAGLMGFNLAPDKAAVGISLSGNSLTNVPLTYTSYTGVYQPVYAGTREVSSYDFSTGTSFTTATQNFEANKYYSVFTLGAKGAYRNVIVNDNLDSLSATGGQAFVRYINAIPDSTKPAVTITASGTDLSNNSTSFGVVSNFTGITPGDITVKVSNGTTISANRTITLEKSKVYTVLLVGMPGATDSIRAIQIKYITNGTIQ